jgi:hypothetical protein
MAPKAPSQPHSLVRDGLRQAVSHLVLQNAIAKCNWTLTPKNVDSNTNGDQ